MDKPLVEALVQHVNETCFQDPRRSIDSIIINGCGLSDQQVSSILMLFKKLRSGPKLASISKDELGELSVKQLCTAIAKGLEKLSLVQVKIPEKNHLPRVFQ
jgi:hypothetical protein